MAFLDDNNPIAIGKICDYDKFFKQYSNAIVAIGNNIFRLEWIKRLLAYGYFVPSLVSPSAFVSPSAYIGAGTIVEPMSVIQSGVTIGKGCLICSGAVIKHNAVIEDGCYVDCNAVVMPNSVVKSGAKINACDIVA